MTAQFTQSNYDRTKCQIGIVHLGYGAFHRAHQGDYIDRYMQQSGDLRWGIAAVNLRAADAKQFAAAQHENGYLLKTVSADGVCNYHAVRAHLRFCDWSCDVTAEELLVLPSVHIVTMTVSESGYCLDGEKKLDMKNSLLVAELAGGKAQSVYAYLRGGLRRRMQAGGGALTILCCDNIRANGRMLCANFDAYLRAFGDDELRDWIGEHLRFPSSMVDRITPQPSLADTRTTQKLFDRQGGPTVTAEDFIQWVIEDDFAAARPQLEEVGVTIARDITAFEEAKIRILNGGHLSIACYGALAGHKTVAQAFADPEIYEHFRCFENHEVLPSVAAPFDKHAYLDKVAARFGNRMIADSLERICTDSCAKHSIYLQPTVADCFAAGHAPKFAIRSVAAWYVLARRVLKGVIDFNYIESQMAALKPLLADGAFDAFANSEKIWGEVPRRHPAFVKLLRAQVARAETKWPA